MLILPLLVCIHFFLIFPMHFSVTKLFNSESMKKKKHPKNKPPKQTLYKGLGFFVVVVFCLFVCLNKITMVVRSCLASVDVKGLTVFAVNVEDGVFSP